MEEFHLFRNYWDRTGAMVIDTETLNVRLLWTICSGQHRPGSIDDNAPVM